MDELNVEGLAGTQSGSIYYLNFSEKVIIRLVSKVSSVQDEIPLITFNHANPALFLTSGGSKSSSVSLYATSTVD